MTICPFVRYVGTGMAWKGNGKHEFSERSGVWISGALCLWLCAKRYSKNANLGLILNG